MRQIDSLYGYAQRAYRKCGQRRGFNVGFRGFGELLSALKVGAGVSSPSPSTEKLRTVFLASYILYCTFLT